MRVLVTGSRQSKDNRLSMATPGTTGLLAWLDGQIGLYQNPEREKILFGVDGHAFIVNALAA